MRSLPRHSRRKFLRVKLRAYDRRGRRVRPAAARGAVWQGRRIRRRCRQPLGSARTAEGLIGQVLAGAGVASTANHYSMDMKASEATFDRQPHLKGEILELRPLREDDFPALFGVASDPLIWEQHPESTRYQEPTFRRFFAEAIASGGALVAIDRADGRVIGSSRYNGCHPALRVVEIGWTFLARQYWGGRRVGGGHARELQRERVCLHRRSPGVVRCGQPRRAGSTEGDARRHPHHSGDPRAGRGAVVPDARGPDRRRTVRAGSFRDSCPNVAREMSGCARVMHAYCRPRPGAGAAGGGVPRPPRPCMTTLRTPFINRQ